MNLADLEKFQQAIDLAENKQREAANSILAALRESHPHNSRVWLCYAFTASDLTQARQALQTAAALDPYNPSLSAAYDWIIRQEQERGLLYNLTEATTLLEPNDTFIEIYPQPPLNLEPARLPSRQTFRQQWRSWWANFDWQLWLGLVCLTIAGLIVLTQFVLPKPLTEAERSYWQSIVSINERANAANAAIQAIVQHPDADYKRQLQSRLKVFSDLNQEFRRLRSPSARFDHLDSLLTLAYERFDMGAALLSQGLATDNPALIEQGNEVLAGGNDFLHQARDELGKIN